MLVLLTKVASIEEKSLIRTNFLKGIGKFLQLNKALQNTSLLNAA
jgi:hypothetical protein